MQGRGCGMRGSASDGTDVFRVETTGRDGRATTVEVIKSDDRYLMRADGASDAAGTGASAGADPVALVQEALVVDAVHSVRITPALWGPSSSELLAALRIDPAAL